MMRYLALLLIALCHRPLAAQAGPPNGSPAAARDAGAVLDLGAPVSVLSLRPRPTAFEVPLPASAPYADSRQLGDPGARLAAGISYGGLGGALLFGLTDTLVGPLFSDESGLSLGLAVFLGALTGATVGGIAGLLGGI